MEELAIRTWCTDLPLLKQMLPLHQRRKINTEWEIKYWTEVLEDIVMRITAHMASKLERLEQVLTL